ncbi:MAG: peptidylprolyl isomerase [Planctomycetota bacterium]|nr:peptidylprolyl isomerase [Planctomycetota bacterium]
MNRVIASLTILTTLCLVSPVHAQDKKADPLLKNLETGIYARVETNFGTMVWRLHYRRAPSAVYNFVGLAEGTRQWNDSKSKSSKKSKFYDGMTFHRVVPGLLAQTGCPSGTGEDGPGYTFAREVHPDLRHDGPGVVSMLATPQGTSHGSQLFVTFGPAPKLNGLYTVFGKVVRGKDVLIEISGSEVDEKQKPKRAIKIKSVTIHRMGAAAKSWDAVKEAFKKIPEAKKEIDKARVWSKKAKETDRLNIQMIVVKYKGLPGASLVCPYEKVEAQSVALKIARLARSKDANFSKLELKYSDERMRGRTLQLNRDRKKLAKIFKDAFVLKTGQVSDPLDTPLGWCILYRPPAVMARHLLITWKGGPFEDVVRSKEEARLIAYDVQKKLTAGASFGDLLASYHDPVVQKKLQIRGRSGGSSAYFAEHEFPPIGTAAFLLKDWEVSKVIETPTGFYIVQRVVPISARHILISWRGNKRIPKLTRSRAEAKTLIEKLQKQIKDGASFESLLSQSDDKVTPGGHYFNFAPEYMVKEFSDVAFKLKVDEISEIVESPFGYHLIQRTK